MTTPNLNDALQTILAGDYGLNEGDHLKLCSILKKAHDESKKGVKTVKDISTTRLDIKLKCWGSYQYCLDTMTTTSYVNGPISDGWIQPDYVVTGFILINDCSKPMTWNCCVDNVIRHILRMNHCMYRIEIERDGIKSSYAYLQFIRDCYRADILEKKMREKYGPLPDGIDESDEAFFRGDYTYNRLVFHIVQALTR